LSYWKNPAGHPFDILLTHGHPDHYAGIANVLKGEDLPVVSTVNVAAVAQKDDAKWDQVGRQLLGGQWPQKRRFPNTLLENSQSVSFDGITFTVTELGPGESGSDTFWQADVLPGIVFSGDVFYNHMHGFLVEGHSAEWLENITKAERQWHRGMILYPGHGGATTPEVLAWQRSYLETFRSAVQELAQGRPRLTDEAKAKVKQRMIAFTGNRRLEPY
jgi:glyoxylase-like metal-dependent hydrolase (beta-lactamase superfamily II)